MAKTRRQAEIELQVLVAKITGAPRNEAVLELQAAGSCSAGGMKSTVSSSEYSESRWVQVAWLWLS